MARTDLWVYNAENLCVSFFNQVASIFHLACTSLQLSHPKYEFWAAKNVTCLPLPCTQPIHVRSLPNTHETLRHFQAKTACVSVPPLIQSSDAMALVAFRRKSAQNLKPLRRQRLQTKGRCKSESQTFRGVWAPARAQTLSKKS